jgi:ribonuclease-3
MPDVAKLEALIGYQFKNPEFAIEALTHGSFPKERLDEGRLSQERLAYVGDAIVDLVVRKKQFKATPTQNRGDMTEAKQGIVNKSSLGELAIRAGFGEVLNRSTTHRLPNATERPWAETLEAVVGAVFLDSNDYVETEKIALKLLEMG